VAKDIASGTTVQVTFSFSFEIHVRIIN